VHADAEVPREVSQAEGAPILIALLIRQWKGI